jgi:hypothetical protein
MNADDAVQCARCTHPFNNIERSEASHPLPNTPQTPAAQEILSPKKHSLFMTVLLVVAGILGVLFLLGIFGSTFLAKELEGAREKSRDAQRVSDIKMLMLAAELYYNENGAYPQTQEKLLPEYLAFIPADPVTNAPYLYARCSPETYHVGATLSSETSAHFDDSDVAYACQADPINGADTAPCSGSGTGHCFDEFVGSLEQPVNEE